jgi:16S rRNA (cytosine967-C5)-methyltransferase
VTCSLFVEENAHQVVSFLAANSDFRPVGQAARLSEQCPALPAKSALVDGHGITFTPNRTCTDGFFVSVIARN